MDFIFIAFIGACLAFFINVGKYRIERQLIDHTIIYQNIEHERLFCEKDEELGFYRKNDHVELYNKMCTKIFLYRYFQRLTRLVVLFAIMLHFLPLYGALMLGYICVLIYDDIIVYLIGCNLIDDIDLKIGKYVKITLWSFLHIHAIIVIFYVVSRIIKNENWFATIVTTMDLFPS